LPVAVMNVCAYKLPYTVVPDKSFAIMFPV
jgi:hypothetical protein